MFHFPSRPVPQVSRTARLFRRSRHVIDPTVSRRLDVLGNQSTCLDSEISALEQFIVTAPRQAQELKLKHFNTLPAPEEFLAAPARRPSRRQLRAMRVRRYKELCGFLFLLFSLGGILLWLGYQLTYYSIL